MRASMVIPADRDSASRSASWPKSGCGGPEPLLVSSRSTVILAQVVQGVGRRGPDDRGGAGYVGGGRVRPELQCPGVHAEQRQPVGQHIVHLPGDAPPLGLARLFGTALLIGLQPVGPLPQ
jgi:hypothetical protein